MGYIQFTGLKTRYNVKLRQLPTQQGGHAVELIFEGTLKVSTNGFCYYTEDGEILGDYTAYTTVYRQDYGVNGYMLSDDGTVYIEPSVVIPEPPVPPEPYVPTLAEVQEQKVTDMNNAQQSIIYNGVTVTLSDGTEETFTLSEHDQTSLIGLAGQVSAGVQSIPWHCDDQSEHCKYYSNADMNTIVTAATALVTFHVTYFRDLRIYIRALTEKADVEEVIYGMTIPVEYQSQVLKDLLANV